jgi:hypothetical protein
MNSAYVRQLNSRITVRQPAPERLSLKDRIEAWFDNQPAVSKVRPYSIVEIETALATQGRYVGPILMSLGWVRRRAYSGAGPYHRYWVPPSK